MKFLYLKTKAAVLAVILALGMAPCYSSADYADSIENIYGYFDSNIMENFKGTLSSSFSEKSTEKLDITAQKLHKSESEIKEFVAVLKQKALNLKHNGEHTTDLCQFIEVLVQLADELEVYFTRAYTTLTNGLNKKLKAVAFAKQLGDVVEIIMTDKNFDKLNGYLTRLQRHTPNHITLHIENIRKDINTLLSEYKKSRSRQNAAAINLLRKRLPY